MTKFDAFTKHAIQLELWANNAAEDVSKILEEYRTTVEAILKNYKNFDRKSILDEIRKKLATEVPSLEKELRELAGLYADVIADKETTWFTKAAKKYDSVDLKIPVITTAFLLSLPYSKKQTPETFIKDIGTKAKNQILNVLKSSYVFGIDKQTAEDSIKKNIDSIESSCKTEFQTMASSMAKNTQKIILLSNTKKYTRYMWSSILDSSTCIVCGDLDGQIFDSLSDTPDIPQHLNCRCSLISLTKDEQTKTETWKDWLSKQDADTQITALGKKRYELYKKGMPVDRFVNDGRLLTLEDVYSKDTI